MSFSKQQVKAYSAAICQHLIEHLPRKFPHTTCIHLFKAIEGYNEPNLSSFAEYVQHTFPMIKICVPRVSIKTHELEHIAIHKNTVWRRNVWQIEEPEDGELVSASDIDMVLVPTLISDIAGNRIGYGKGFYDRFLMDCKPGLPKIGVSFFEPLPLRSFEVHAFDIPITHLVTQGGWRQCSE